MMEAHTDNRQDASDCESRIPEPCFHRWLVYRTVRRPRWTIRYKRCSLCSETSKTVQVGFVDARQWSSC
jgi:hypothetical protein